MATSDHTYPAVPGNVYARYTSAQVIELMEMDEPMGNDSDDELELHLGSGDELLVTHKIQNACM